METIAHRQLKRLALTFLRKIGCLAVAEEVRCPISRYRVDAAGYLDRRPRKPTNSIERDSLHSTSLESLYEPVQDSKKWWRCRPRTIMIECKQSRADFLRDSRDQASLLNLREDLQRIRGSIEEHQIKSLEPQLRRDGSSLFPELEDWDFHESCLPSYRNTMRKLRRVERQLFGETKFHMIARYRLADRLFIAAPNGMLRPGELPLGWGLLECPRECLERTEESDQFDDPPCLIVRGDAAEYDARNQHRQRLLRNIAIAASFMAIPGRATLKIDQL